MPARRPSRSTARRAPSARPAAGKVDLVLSPQSEVPRGGLGQDRSQKKTSVKELTWKGFDTLVTGLARTIRKDFKPDAVVGVAHGGVFVGGAVASALSCDFYPVRISRRSRDKVVRKQPRMSGEMPKELKGKKVLVVDDVSSSGDTLELAQALADKVGAKQTRSAALVARVGGYSPDFVALSTDELVVFPWDYESVAEDGRFDVDPDKAGA